jgi:hypothetical protein
MKHEVTFDIPSRDLGRADIHFRVKINGATFGKLEISNGSLVWYPKDLTYGHKISWSQFDADAKAHPRMEKRKRLG